MKILLTGGLGYIGSHCAVDLLAHGHEVVIVDNLSRCALVIHQQIERVSGKNVPLFEYDVADYSRMELLCVKHAFDAVIHFAAYKAVGQSVETPLMYYENNLESCLSVLRCVQNFHIPHFVFSSSCTVYGYTTDLPVHENSPFLPPTSPYGATKQMCEKICEDTFSILHPRSNCVILRYFNPIGAHHSGQLGELPIDKPQNLLPALVQAAAGQYPRLQVYGTDYDTPDGSCMRDYIHVEDLARAHRLALLYARDNASCCATEVFNVGTGKPMSVLEIIRTFERISGQPLPYDIAPRRSGDLPSIHACVQKAGQILGFRTQFSLEDMIKSAWVWQQYLPRIYQPSSPPPPPSTAPPLIRQKIAPDRRTLSKHWQGVWQQFVRAGPGGG